MMKSINPSHAQTTLSWVVKHPSRDNDPRQLGRVFGDTGRGVVSVDYHVMVVDDDAGMLQLIEVILKRHRFSISKATDGFTALEMLETETPDILILDVMMPEMDGIELCHRIRAIPKLQYTPIIILSAKSDLETVRRGIQAGANAYLSKTMLASGLVPEIKKLLNHEVKGFS